MWKSNVAAAALLMASAAQAQVIGDWYVDQSPGEMPYMATANDSGELFGKWCDGDTCYWLVMGNTPCTNGVSTPIIISMASSAFASEMICTGTWTGQSKTYYRYGLTLPDTIDQQVVNGLQVNMAVPIENNQFRVIRFRTAQAAGALARWRSLLVPTSKTPRPAKSTVSETL